MTVRTTWHKLKAEEKFLLFFSFATLVTFYFSSRVPAKLYDFFLLEVDAFTVSFSFFQGAVILAAVYFIYFYIKKFLELAGLSIVKRGDKVIGLGDLAKKAAGLARPFFFLFLGFSSLVIALSGVTADVQGRLVSGMLFKWDENIFGAYPFIWLHTASNPLKPLFDFLAPLIIICFQGLSLLIGATLVFFAPNKKIYPAFVISFFMTMGIGLFFWWVVPANSPNNYYLSADHSIPGYVPDRPVLVFEEDVREHQKKIPPISTFPSSHVNWGMQIVYFWAVYNRKTLFISVPWFLLMALGTVYLAQHYAVDVLLGIPLGVVSIMTGKMLAGRLASKKTEVSV